eukprot:SM000169S02701  [mRNA]  locus=s169:12678:15510:+ [translate_table: standard]
MLTMAADSGLLGELVLGDPDSPRFVLWRGRLRPVPAGLADLPFFDLLSPWGKLRAGLGAAGLRPPPPAGKEESVEEFVRRNLGAEVFERLIEPFCSGVYAGNPSKLSMKAAFGKVWRLEQIGGSIVGGSLQLIQDRRANPPPPPDPRLPVVKGQTVGSFKRGLSTLPNAIAAQLGEKVKVRWELIDINKSEEGFRLSYSTPSGPQTVLAKKVILTVPSRIASKILRPTAPRAADALAKFYYPPVCAVTVSYPTSAIREDRLVNGELKGFGQLHPRSQGIQTLGTIYSSSLFPNRAPKGRTLLLCYIGGATNEEITTKACLILRISLIVVPTYNSDALPGEDAIVAAVDKDLRTMLLRDDAPSPTAHGCRVWPTAIPQFNVGHLDTLEEARQGLKDAGLDGLLLGGNYVAGVALGRCVEAAYESAAEVASMASKTAVA